MTDQTPPEQRVLHATRGNAAPPPEQPRANTRVRAKRKGAPISLNRGYGSAENIRAFADAIKDQPLEMAQQMPGSFTAQRPRRADPTPPPGFDFQGTNREDLPNWDKLSGTERAIYNALPGFSGALADMYHKWDASWYGGAVDRKIREVPWLTKFGADALSALDVGAEALERVVGTAAQVGVSLGDPEHQAELTRNFKAAWYAGGLAADAADVSVELDLANGHISVPQELGGINQIVRARQRIAELAATGVSYHDALMQARDEYYQSLGALALRAQLNDLAFHTLADPINLLLPKLEPVERLQTLRTKLTGMQATAEGVAEVEGKIASLSKSLEAARVTQNADEIAKLEADVLRTEKYLEQARASRLTHAEQKLTWALGFGDEERGAENIVKLTGGENLPGSKAFNLGVIASGDVKKGIRGLVSTFNPFALTKEARVQEGMTVLLDNITSHHVAANIDANGVPDPEGLVRSLTRVRDGAFAPEMGNMALTLDGRSVRSFLGEAADTAETKLAGFRQVKLERDVLSNMAEVLGVTPPDLLARLQKGEAATVIDLFQKKLAALPEAQAQLGARVEQMLLEHNLEQGITPDLLARVTGVLGEKGFAGYTPELFVSDLLNDVSDIATRQLIQMFGVKEQGLIRNIADTVKAAESLAFLRMNPAYPVRNWVNNNVTMIARGAFGSLDEFGIEAFWKRQGFEPARLREAGLAMEAARSAQGGLSRSAELIHETTSANAGWLGKVTDMLSGVKAPDAINPGEWARKVEALASRRAYTTYYIKSFQPFYQKALGKFVDHAPELARSLPKSLAGEIDRAVLGATREADLDALRVSDNLKLNLPEIVSRTESRTGLKLDHIISAEFQAELEDGLADAARTGKLDEFFTGLESKVQRHLDDAMDNGLASLRDEAAARVKAEGPGSFTHLWADMTDEWYGAHERHALDVGAATDLIRQSKPKEADALWRSSMAEGDAYFSRQWNRLEARMQGFAEGGAAAGLNGEAVMSNFRQWRGGWKQFFEKRTRLYTEYFDAIKAGGTPAKQFEAITAELQSGYAKMADFELRAQKGIDVGLAQMLPENQRPTFLAWRNKVAALRAADKEAVSAFREVLPGIPASERQAEYAKHWAGRVQAWQRLANEERAGRAAMAGNQLALGRFQADAGNIEEELQTLTDLLGKKSGGELAGGEQQTLDRIVNQYATPEEARKLNALQADKSFDFTNPPQTPTLEGSQALEKEAAREALAPETVNLEIPRNYRVTVETGTVEGPKIVVREAHTGGAAEWGPYKFLTNDEKANGWRVAPAHEVDLWVEEQSQKLYGDKHHTWDEIQADIVNQKRTTERARGGASAAQNTVTDLERQLEAAKADVKKLAAEAKAERAGGSSVGPANQAYADAQRRAKALSVQLAESKKAGVAVDVDKALLAERQAARDAQKAAIEEGVWKRLGGQVNEQAAAQEAARDAAHLPSLDSIVKPELYMGTGIDQLWYTKGQSLMRELKASAGELAGEAPLKWGDLPAEAQKAVGGYIEHARGAMADARYAAMRMGEYGRDSALLNYSRRFNYNTWLGTIAPYEFWATQSAYKWALHSIDRPGMLAAYLRMRRFMDTAYRPEQGFPSRLQGSFRVQLPFMPEWMGKDTFINPLRLMLPFDGWTSPFEEYGKQQMADLGAAERTLEALLNDGKITDRDYKDALETHSGPTWERAMALARQDDTEGRMSGADLASSLLPFHLPILYALDAAQNRNPFEERGPIIPLTRNIGSVLATLGADPSGPLNPEAALRKAAGLHPFSKWDDYYAERELTNMVAMGELSVTDARQALVQHAGAAWEQAMQRSRVEASGGNLGTALSGAAGLPMHGYPPGEEYLRTLKDEYQAAWAKYDRSGDYAATVGAFNDQHPGYEERLALFKKPEERLRQFTTDAFWDRWGDLPKLTQHQLLDQMGPEFENFISADGTPDEKKAYRAGVPTDTLAVWLKLMGGDPPGTLNPATGTNPPTLDLAPPEVAQRAQVFYDTRETNFTGWRENQEAYFAIDEDDRVSTGPDALAGQYLALRDEHFPGVAAALAQYDTMPDGKEKTAYARANGLFDYFQWRKNFKADNPGFTRAIGYNDVVKGHSVSARSLYAKAHPVLTAYWDWRKSFLGRNPDLAPYLTDKPEDADSAPIPVQDWPQFTKAEWQQAVGFSLWALALDYHLGEDLPPGAEARLVEKARGLGINASAAEIAAMIEASQ